MRKIVPILLFGALVLAGCQRETAPAEQEESFEIGFNVGLDVTKGALAAGKDATDLYVLVFNAEGKLISTSEPIHSDTQVWKPQVKLLRGNAYTVAFWAQYHPGTGQASLYNINGAFVEVAQDYLDTGLETVDRADAFWGKVEIPATGTFSTNVTLIRPFAQVSLLVPASNYSLSYSYVNAFSITVDGGFPGAMNLCTGQVIPADTQVVDYLPGGKVDVNPVDETIGEESFKRLASVYIFAPATPSSLSAVSFIVEDDKCITTSKSVENVSVQRNKRTRITGNLFVYGL